MFSLKWDSVRLLHYEPSAVLETPHFHTKEVKSLRAERKREQNLKKVKKEYLENRTEALGMNKRTGSPKI